MLHSRGRLLIHSLSWAHLPLPPPRPSSSVPSPLSLSLREIAAYSPRLVRSRPTERPNDGRTDSYSLALSLARCPHYSSNYPPLSLARSVARLLARSLSLPRGISGGRRLCLWKRERRSPLRRSVRPTVQKPRPPPPSPSPAQSETPSHIFCAHRERSDRRIISEFTDYDSAASRVHDSVEAAMN